ncbi:hypothetical protein D3C87_144760 [compost metagenome]
MNVKKIPAKRRAKYSERTVRQELALKGGLRYESVMQTESSKVAVTYRDYIDREFRRRCRRNSQYSLRAFARDIEVSPSKLSEVMRRKCGLSAHAAELLCEKLKLSEVETQHFIVLVEAEHSRNSTRKAQARDQLREFQVQHGYGELDLERFKIISEWYHLALLEMMECETFESDIDWMANQLGLDAFVVAEALERLETFGLLKSEETGYRPTGSNLAAPSGVPSREMREFHLQMMNKGLDCVENGSIEERDVSHIMMSIDAKDFPKAQDMIKKFRREFATLLQENPTKNSLYALGIQFFPLDNKGKSHDV